MRLLTKLSFICLVLFHQLVITTEAERKRNLSHGVNSNSVEEEAGRDLEEEIFNLRFNFEVDNIWDCDNEKDCEGPDKARSCVTAKCVSGKCVYSFEKAKKLKIEFLSDFHPEDMSWKVYDTNFSFVPIVEADNYTKKETYHEHEIYVCDSFHMLNITERHGDGFLGESYFAVFYKSNRLFNTSFVEKYEVFQFQLCDTNSTCDTRKCFTSVCVDSVCNATTKDDEHRKIRVDVKTDIYPFETVWLLRDKSFNYPYEIAQHHYEPHTIYSKTVEACYGRNLFAILDSYGDGILNGVSNSSGYYKVFLDEEEIFSGGDFFHKESKIIEVDEDDSFHYIYDMNNESGILFFWPNEQELNSLGDKLND